MILESCEEVQKITLGKGIEFHYFFKESERQRTSGTQKRSKSDFMYCRKFPF